MLGLFSNVTIAQQTDMRGQSNSIQKDRTLELDGRVAWLMMAQDCIRQSKQAYLGLMFWLIRFRLVFLNFVLGFVAQFQQAPR